MGYQLLTRIGIIENSAGVPKACDCLKIYNKEDLLLKSSSLTKSMLCHSPEIVFYIDFKF